MKRALVLGLGKSGLAAGALLHHLGYAVLGIDQQMVTLPEYILGTFCGEWSEIELVVVSPGISPYHPVYREAQLKGIELIGEAELALRHLDQPAVAVTGTNGKTTVTLLTTHCLMHAGIKARALGNVGDPLAAYVLHPDPTEVAVVELSSYQLETLSAPVFDVGVILNITPDHLDRYTGMEEYAAAKCRLQQCVKPSGAFYVQTQAALEWKQGLSADYHTFGDAPESEIPIPSWLRALSLAPHDQVNALAAWLLCEPWGVTRGQFREALATFRKPAHRIEFVAEVRGVQFFDDSKGTNIDAMMQAVRAMPSSVVVIVGGVDKGASYLPWKALGVDKVKCLLTLGEAAPKIEEELSSYFTCQRVKTLDEAVQKAQDYAKPGECVLLSPGCSSFDQFRDYVHRGEEFQRAVLSLKKGE